MFYLIFETQQEAQEAVNTIDAKVRSILEEKAPSIIDEEGIISRNASTGELDPSAARTTTWATPRQRVDNKWCFPKLTETYNPLFTGVDFTEGIEGYTEEEYQSDWFVDIE